MEKDMKELILNYLQLHGWELQSKVPAISELKYEDDPPRLVIHLVRESELPEIKMEGKLLTVDVKITGEPVIMNPKEDEEMPKPEKQASVKDDGLFHHNVGDGEAMGPFERSGKNSKAYEAWKKRWPSIGVPKKGE